MHTNYLLHGKFSYYCSYSSYFLVCTYIKKKKFSEFKNLENDEKSSSGKKMNPSPIR